MALKESDRRSYMLGLQIAGDFGANLAVPVVLFVLLGKWLQNKYGFAPFGVIVGFLLASVISYKIISRKVTWYASEYKALQKSDKK